MRKPCVVGSFCSGGLFGPYQHHPPGDWMPINSGLLWIQENCVHPATMTHNMHYLSIYLSSCLSIYLSIHLSISFYIYMRPYLSVTLSTYLPTYPGSKNRHTHNQGHDNASNHVQNENHNAGNSYDQTSYHDHSGHDDHIGHHNHNHHSKPFNLDGPASLILIRLPRLLLAT